MLSAYCLSYGNWTVIPKHWDYVFGELKENAFDAVDLSFSESEARYALRTFEQQIAMAHKHNLKVFVIPSRIGGRFAGAPLMPSFFTANNPLAQHKKDPLLARLDSVEFLDWSVKFIEDLCHNFDFDGVIWDEPKGIDNNCSDKEIDLMVEYLTLLTQVVKKNKPDNIMTIFNMPGSSEKFTSQTAKIANIDYAGFDGSCCKQSYFHEEPQILKPSLIDMWERTKRETNNVCKTFGLIENMLIPSSENENYEAILEETLKCVNPDHLSCYYYAHNNESAEIIQKITFNKLKQILK